MSAFTSRTGGYKFGVFFLVFASVVFLVGFASPYWFHTTFERIRVSYHEGLWRGCDTTAVYSVSTSSCFSLGVDLNLLPSWFHGVRALLCCCLISLIVACVYILYTNCCRSVAGPRTRILEVLAAGSGLLSFTGCMIYLGYFLDSKDDSSSISKKIESLNHLDDMFTSSLYWAFYLTVVGSVLCLVAAFIIFVSNIEIPVSTSEVGYGGQPVIVMSNVPVQAPPQGYYVSNKQYYEHSQPAAYVSNQQHNGHSQPAAYVSNQPHYGHSQPAAYVSNQQHYGHSQPAAYPPPKAGYSSVV